MSKYQILQKAELFNQLDEQAVMATSSICEKIIFPKDKIIFLDGDKATHVYVVISGWVKMYKTSIRGNDSVLKIIGQDQIFGEMSCFAKNYHNVSAQAISKVEILKVPQKEFLRAIKIDENYQNILSRWFFEKQNSLIKQIEEITNLNIEEKLALFFLRLSKIQNNNIIELPYSKAIIASQLNTKPETISRALKLLKNEDFIDFKNKTITIKESDKLNDFCKL